MATKSATKLNSSTEAVLSQYVYGYDLGGNRTSEQIGLGVTQTALNNLKQITSTGAGGPLQFSGTLSKPAQVTVAGNAATTSYSTNFAGNANVTTGTNTVAVVARDVDGNTATNNYQVVVPAGSSVTPSYDGDGNLTNNGNGQAYTWDAKNELTTITYTGGATSNFSYDALGRRISMVEKNSSGTVTSTKQFVWIGTNIAEERDASNIVTKRFFAQGEQISGTNYYYTRDHLGSIREMVDNSGSIQARYAYDPYGRATKISGSLDADYQYAGYYEHAPSGLNLTLFRAYDPNTARWLSRDPAGEIERSDGHGGTLGGLNLYGYVDNNPVDFTDFLGLGHGSGLGSNGQMPSNNNGSDADQTAAMESDLFGDTTTNQSPGPVNIPPVTADDIVNVAAFLSIPIAPELTPAGRVLLAMYLGAAKLCSGAASK